MTGNSDRIDNLLHVGLDVGSTTVKAVVMDALGKIIWKDYRRHNAKQPELVHEFLIRIEREFSNNKFAVFITGNGGRSFASHLNAIYIQEVNALTYVVEKMHPRANSVVELGGQDAKVIIWKEDSRGRKSTMSFMNDKCAGGTGATLDRVFSKIGLGLDRISHVHAKGKTIHPIAAKCGVFAETDVVGLLKAGVDEEEIVVSMCTAVVKQNIEVLLHGNALRDDVLLLGGPHTYFPVLTEIWRTEIPETWRIHKWTSKNKPIEDLVFVPPDAQYFAAIGAVLFGRDSTASRPEAQDRGLVSLYPGIEPLERYLSEGKQVQLLAMGGINKGLVASEAERAAFEKEYAIPDFAPPRVERGANVGCYMGIDGGSTSSKIVLLDEDGELLYKDYVLSRGNPIVDVREMFRHLKDWMSRGGFSLDIKGTGVTGYACNILKQAFNLDIAIVETVAHMKAAKRYYGDVDLICDVGGQDIKVLFLKHGRVVDIKLNTQCSAGNGYFLQNMAEQFGVPVEEYAARAFDVRQAPSFNYGCAVFMEQDKVNFQQLGWTENEIMAGLALVLPLNIWNYVVQEANLRRFGLRFLLQGGTQRNLAAVKSQVDFIKSRVPQADVKCHKYADICGAIGAAIEAIEEPPKGASSFVGVHRAVDVTFKSKNNDETVCNFCSNHCPRTFIDITLGPDSTIRYISGNACDKGMSDNLSDMRLSESSKKKLKEKFPNLVHKAGVDVFAEYDFDEMPKGFADKEILAKRARMVVGIPRLLNLYVYAPFFSTYFRALGLGQVVYSDYTSQELWSEGNKFGAIDPCFPAKVAPAHIYNLLKKDVTHICFPMITHLESMLENTLGNNACVIQMGTTEVVHAAFTKTGKDYFEEAGVEFWKPLVRMDRRPEAIGNLLDYFKERLQLTQEENAWAAEQGNAAMERYFAGLREEGAQVLNNLIDEDKIGILFLGHPYHHDPGLNHGILEEFQLRGFPILSIESLPSDVSFLGPLFGDGDGSKDASQRDISDVWQRNFNRNTNAKIWAAGVAARHPNLAVIDLSSFKCGHDAPTYSYLDNILDASRTPHFLFHDIDQSKPSATIKIRIQSIEYFLRLEEERLRERIREIEEPLGETQ
jgi:activator of 2-hydroxyglutaryl-CoA dehydratase/predicted nucleotide-binding protein (sugar kinase/HSP70/actin superfamily)